MGEDSFVIPDTGATAKLVCFWSLTHRNSLLGETGLLGFATYPAQATSKFGDGRMGDVRFAADITGRIAGAKGNFPAFVLGAGIPALLRKGASGPLG